MLRSRPVTLLRAVRFLIPLLLCLMLSQTITADDGPSPEAPPHGYANLPLYFEENQGQMAEAVRYFAHAGGYSVFATQSQIAFNVLLETTDTTASTYGLYLNFVGAQADTTISGEGLQAGISSYFKGTSVDWVTGVPHYGAIRYKSLYTGIDAVFYGTEQQVQYDFMVAPHADPAQIRLNIEAAESVELAENGDLHLNLGQRVLTMHAPYSYQTINGVQRAVESHFVLDGMEVSFAVGAYDERYPLVIDPVIAYSGYIGGSWSDIGYGLTVDAAGNTYIIGKPSREYTFPVVGGPRLVYIDGNNDLFVAKTNATGTALVYAGYVGGSGASYRYNMAADANGSLYLVGSVTPSGTFPVAGTLDTTFNGGSTDGFIMKLNPTGTALEYSAFIGGSGADSVNGVTVDASGNVYVTGSTTSTEATFPVAGTGDVTHNGGSDAFIAKINAAGTAFVYNSYVGGSGNDAGSAIKVDAAGSAYITGTTTSTEATFPVLSGPDLTANGGTDAFIAKINPAGSTLVYNGYIGSSADDMGPALALDGQGNAYIMLLSYEETDLPVLSGPYIMPHPIDSVYLYLAKINATGSALVYAGYVSVSSYMEYGFAMTVDSAGYAYVATITYDQNLATANALDTTYNGDGDIVLAKINPDGADEAYITYIGGDKPDTPYALAVDGSDALYLTGSTRSTEATFPLAVGSDLTYNGDLYFVGDQDGGDAFIMKLVDYQTVFLAFDSAASSANEAVGLGNVLRVTTSNGNPTNTATSVSLIIGGSATADDYSGTGTITIPAGTANNALVSIASGITVTDDSTYEPDETLVLTLTSPVGASLGAQKTHTFTILNEDAAPPLPAAPTNLISPVPGPGRQPTLKWTGTPYTKFEIQLDVVNPPQSTPQVVNAQTFVPSAPLPLTTTYYWRVRSYDASNVPSDWSAVSSFTIVSPANAVPGLPLYQTTTPRLSWEGVSWATGYQLQVDDVATFATPAYNNDQLGADEFSDTPVLSNGTFYWRVRAKRANGTWGPWSLVDSFIIYAP